MSTNNEMTECSNKFCTDGYVDKAFSNQDGTESWVDQVPCQVCNGEPMNNQEYVQVALRETAYEVIKRTELWDLMATNIDIDDAAERLATQFESLVDSFIRAETEKLGVMV